MTIARYYLSEISEHVNFFATFVSVCSTQLLLLLIHTFSVFSLQLKKLRRHNKPMSPPKPLDISPPEGECSEGLDAFRFFLNKSAIDLLNANPACGHKEVRRSTGHIMVTTRHCYSDQ